MALSGKADRRHGRRRLHRHDARAAARRRERDHRGRQPAPRHARRHRRSPSTRTSPSSQGDVLDAPFLTEVRERRDAPRPRGRDRRRRHGDREPGAHDAREPHRHVQRARGRARDEGHDRARHRVLDERGVRHVRLQGRRAARHDAGVGRRGALDVRGLEARRRAHGARVPRRARTADGLGAAVQRLRAGPDRRRRDPGVHRDGARGEATS